MRHLLTLADLTTAEIERIFSITEDSKTKFARGLREPLLPGRAMALIFEKPSLRTRVSFEAAMVHLGGSSLFLGKDVGFGQRESVADFGRVLSEYVDVVVLRTNSHKTAVDLARHSRCAVDKRPDRFRPSLPGHGRPVHRPRAGRPAGRANAGLGGRRQQRGPQPGPGLRPPRPAARHGHARKVPVRREVAGLAAPGGRRAWSWP